MKTLSELTWAEIKQTISEILEKRKDENFRKHDFTSDEASICFYFAEKYDWLPDKNKDMDLKDFVNLPKIYHALFKDVEARCSPSYIQWISVDEAMPELNEEVLVCFPDGSYGVAHREERFAVTGLVTEWRNGDYTYYDAWIRYWMRIPNLNLNDK